MQPAAMQRVEGRRRRAALDAAAIDELVEKTSSLWRRDARQALRTTRRLEKAALRIGHPVGVASARNTQGFALLRLSQNLAAIPAFRGALSAADACSLPEVAQTIKARAHNGLGVALRRVGDREGAIENFVSAARYGQMRGMQVLCCAAYGNIANLFDQAGDREQTERYARLALEFSRDSPEAATSYVLLAARCRMQLRLREGRQHLQDAIRCLEAAGDTAAAMHTLALDAGMAYLQGDRATAKQLLQELVRSAHEAGLKHEEIIVLQKLGQAHAHGGFHEAAGVALETALRLSVDSATAPHEASVLRHLRALHLRAGQAEQAVARTRRMHRVQTRGILSNAAGHADLLLAELQVERERHRAQALNERNRALERANRLLLQECMGLYTRLAESSAQPQSPGMHSAEPLPAPQTPAVAALTARESTVLGYLARGYTNPRIAAELGISVFTVREYVSSLLGKLGAPTRTAAVGVAHARGLIGSRR